MTQYLFVFGRTPALAALELLSFFPENVNISEGFAIFSTNHKLDTEKLIGKLGGTVKIGIVREIITDTSPEEFAKILAGTKTRRINFGISSYIPNFQVTERLLFQIKAYLEDTGFSARFISGKNDEPLSSVVVEKQKIRELILAEEKDKILVAETMAVQPFEEWNERDYGRPYADPHAGMLPPKVARMAVNIGLPSHGNGKLVLLDPFCGMGTILAEALLTGFNAIGSDQSKEVVNKAKANLEWLAKKYQSVDKSALKFITSDATHVSDIIEPNSVDVIVTEPFMGTTCWGANDKLQISNKQIEVIKNAIKGLEKLYIGCFKDWTKVLKPGGKVIIALPEYSVNGGTFFVKKVIDNCENLGYTVQTGPIEYSRDQAVVRRKFFVLQKSI